MPVRVRLVPPTAPLEANVCAVIVDVLRATTTLIHAFQNGASRAIPAGTLEEARTLAAQHPGALLCGEREGQKIEGFDLGNSPFEYTHERVAGRTLIFASTNGSLAMRSAAPCRRRLLAAFVNLAAVVYAVVGEREIVIVCGGKLGRFSLEDSACAGLLVERLASRGATPSDPESRLVRALAPRVPSDVLRIVQGSSHARYLRGLGSAFARDVEFCAGLDRSSTVPEF